MFILVLPGVDVVDPGNLGLVLALAPPVVKDITEDVKEMTGTTTVDVDPFGSVDVYVL